MSVSVRSARLLTPISTRPRDLSRAACDARSSKSDAVRVALITTNVSCFTILESLHSPWHGRLARAARGAVALPLRPLAAANARAGRPCHVEEQPSLPLERPRPRERLRAAPVRPPPQRLERPGDRVVI